MGVRTSAHAFRGTQARVLQQRQPGSELLQVLPALTPLGLRIGHVATHLHVLGPMGPPPQPPGPPVGATSSATDTQG